jgi:hypothetical protein
MSPHRKRDRIYLCVEVFSHELEELHLETFKNSENHNLGDVKTPLHYTLFDKGIDNRARQLSTPEAR